MHSTNNSKPNHIDVSANAVDLEIYDIPKPATPVNYDLPKTAMRRIANSGLALNPNQRHYHDTIMLTKSLRGEEIIQEEDESYDIPRPLYNNQMYCQQQQQQLPHTTLTPSSSNSSLLTASESLSLSFSSSNRSSLAGGNIPDYDIPRRNPLPVHRQLLLQQQQHYHHQQQQYLLQQKQQQQQFKQNYVKNYPIAATTSASSIVSITTQETANLKVLPLNLNSALETLDKLHNETTNVISRLLSFVYPNWRQPEKLEPQLMEINLALLRLRAALHGLTEFGEGALANAQRSEDSTLANKLRPLVRALRDANNLICETSQEVELQGGWTLKNLARGSGCDKNQTPDSLDQLFACTQTLTEDVRQITSFIQGNASLLFRRQLDEQHAAAVVAAGNNGEWLEDYDYVSFESKDAATKKNIALREKIVPTLKQDFDTALKTAEKNAIIMTDSSILISSKSQDFLHKDKLLLRYYAGQICTHMCSLRQAIDSFLETVERNQPPKYFIAYGKFVVVCAHNLVTIGDIVHRNISKFDLRDKILNCTNALTDALRTCVNKSTKAAAHFPSIIAVQEMVDSVVDISHLATELKTTILQALQLKI